MSNNNNLKRNSIVKAFNRCRDGLTRSIIKMSVRPEDVDDILQETFLRAYVAEKKLKIDSPQDYLFVISRNLVIKQASDRSRAIKALIDNASVIEEESDIETDLDTKRKFNALNDAMKSLPEKNRRAILLRKVYGFSSHEIARLMGVSKSSVDKYIAEGIRNCGRSLETRGYQNSTTDIRSKPVNERTRNLVEE